MLTHSPHRHSTARRLSWLVVFALMSVALFAPSAVAPTFAGDKTEIMICHGTGSSQDPYVQESPAINSSGAFAGELASGHNQHAGPVWFDGIDVSWGDIIPPYDFEPTDFHYPGLNWTPDGQAIYDNDCAIAEPTPEPTPEATPEPTPDPKTVPTPEPTPTLSIDKTNDAPIEPIDVPDGTLDLPTADEGDTLTYTLKYDLVGGLVTNGVITDVLPVGVTYVNGSATDNADFTFQGYDDATRTLMWTADDVSGGGTVTYLATVDDRAAEFVQPLVNVATVDSDETEPDGDDSPVFVRTIPAAETGTPRPTLPPSDTTVNVPGHNRQAIPRATVTLPPSDTLPIGMSASADDRWRLILFAMAGLLAGALLVTSATANRKDDRRR